MKSIARTLQQSMTRWPAPARYRDPARPAVLFLQYSMVTGGASCYIQRLADGLADVATVDVAAYLEGAGDPVSDLRTAAWLPNGQAGDTEQLLRHAYYAGYRYVDTAFPLRDKHLDWIESILAVCPRAALGIRLHSEMCFLRHYVNIRSRRLMARAAVIYVHHDRMRSELLSLFGDESAAWSDKIVVLPPGVDLERFNRAAADPAAAADYAGELGLIDPAGRKRLVVAMAGRPSPEKNWLDYAILCRRLKDAFGDKLVCLAITGRQRGLSIKRHGCLDEFRRLNSTLGAPCRITGLFSDWQNVLASVDVYVQLSSTESFCRTAAEAAAMRIPVVATRVGGLAEIVVDHGRTGFTVPVAAHAWCRRLTAAERNAAFWHIADLLTNERTRAVMGDAGRQRALRIMDDAETMVQQRAIVRGVISDFGFRIADCPEASGSGL